MLAGSSEVASKKIPFVTFLLIAICLIATVKAYSLDIQANISAQQSFTAFMSHGPVSNTAEIKELEDFHNAYGFKISDFKEKNFLSIFTHMFIHTDLIKLAANMLALWVFAVAMEELLGAGMFLGLFFSGGIIAAIAQGFCDLETTCPLIGANGAVAAVMAAYLTIFGLFSTVKLFNFRILWFSIKQMPAQVFCALWLFSQIKGIFAGASAVDVALVANLVGFGVGLVIGQCVQGRVDERIVVDAGGGVQIDSGVKAEKTEQQKLDEALEAQPFSIIAQAFADMNVPCPACGSSLDMKNPVGDRLVRCGGKCSQMTYVDGQVLANCFVQQPA